MNKDYLITLDDIIKIFDLEILNMPIDPKTIEIKTTDVSRPSLQLAGYTDIFKNDRIQVMGKTEIYYLRQLHDYEIAEKRCQRYFDMQPVATIICKGLDCADYILNAAKNANSPLLRTNEDTCELISSLIYELTKVLAPKVTRHGVLMEIYGEGIMIMGESGIGKSEVAVELISRGHRLVADDAVEIRKLNNRTLLGSSPENIRHYMELRGIGIVSARQLFGMASVKENTNIDLIIKLETWDDSVQYERYGNTKKIVKILNVKVPIITIPVKPGRNLAVIIQAAAMNHRLRKMGFNPTEELFKGLNIPIDEVETQEVEISLD